MCFQNRFLQNLSVVFVCAPAFFQVYSAKTEKNSGQHLSYTILAAQVLNLGLWDAGPHFWDQCWHYAPTTRYRMSSSWQIKMFLH